MTFDWNYFSLRGSPTLISNYVPSKKDIFKEGSANDRLISHEYLSVCGKLSMKSNFNQTSLRSFNFWNYQEVELFARYFLLVARYFLLVPPYSLLVTFCLLLVTFCSLLIFSSKLLWNKVTVNRKKMVWL